MNISRTAAGRWSQVAAGTAVAVLATGCTHHGTSAADVSAGPSTSVTPVRSTPSARPLPSPPYPVNANGRH
ncbi:MAG TPA: hypothetical protein VGE95_04670, partial [Arthrobacter sp.]